MVRMPSGDLFSAVPGVYLKPAASIFPEEQIAAHYKAGELIAWHFVGIVCLQIEI